MEQPRLLKHLEDLKALQPGDLLKYDGEKLVKAIAGTDYGAIVGSNSNSRWVKYADGTMLLTMDHTASCVISETAGNLFRGNAGIPPDFPVPFVAPPSVQITLCNAFGFWLGGMEKAPSTTNPTADTLVSVLSWERKPAVQITVSVLAVGRWK